VEVAYKILDGEVTEFVRIPVDTFLIDQNNIDEYGIDGWQ
jgi:ribose transport system substrate-binding protein